MRSPSPATADHEHSAQLDVAVQWLVSTPRSARPGPLVPALRKQFGLSPIEACQAIREYNVKMARAS
jgi:hypothetical protein